MNTQASSDRAAATSFAVPAWVDWLGGSVARRPRLWQRLGRLESSALRERIQATPIQAPVYVSGLARSGSTVLLEMLAAHPDMATHRYRDFPLVYTPWWWNRFLDRAQRAPAAATERAHGDGILITPDSPEAVEEVLWMGFFPHLHRPGASDVLGFMTDAPVFEDFYRDHLRKLLLLRGGRRYLAKGNYNTTRIEYLLNLFPDARFVLPVREPAAHVASLMRQHRRFAERHAADPRALRYMSRLGHFEFGLDRRPVHIGDGSEAAAIAAAWAAGREAEGYARAWNDLYRFVADRLDAMPALREAVLIVRHEDLCMEPERSLRRLFAHCALDAGPAYFERCVAQLRCGAVGGPGLDASDRQLIQQITAETAARYGYGRGAGIATPPLRTARSEDPFSRRLTG
ncbi:sulfotransferase [Sinimarinibacterium flocculans]|uniref:sulfotransferase n=1 Tax=Sinimarinibacterium flocculans TaxID=985250 RepID=UPI00248F5F28|nr:sulfotransferase [Sinimarinibacterium flocculans]